jgi:RHS repeat-associated protein
VRNPLGHVEKFRYDRLNRLCVTTRALGTQFAYEYDGMTPRCVSSYGPEGLFEVHLERDPEKRTTFVDGEEPRVVVWNELGMVERLMLPDGSVLEEAAYDDDGLRIAQANGAGEGWQYWYDARGRQIRTMDPCQQVTAYEWEGDNLVAIVGPDRHATRFAYDATGALTSVEYPWGERYFFEYDARGRVVGVTGNLGRIASYEYDGQSNVIADTDALGARTTYRYDGMGRPIARRDALGRDMHATYDAAGQRLSLTASDGAKTTFAYDAAGNVSRVVDALGRSTRYVYAGLQALSEVVGPDGRSWKIEQTKEERVRRIVNALGEEYLFERDLAGRVVVEKTFDGRAMRYVRDGAGRVARIAYPDATERSFAYDRAGRLVQDATSDDTRRFARDPLGRMTAAVLEGQGSRDETRFERDAFGRLIGETRGDRRIRYEVDTLGRRTLRVLPNGATTRYAYDAADAITAVDHDGYRVDFQRDALGREIARSAGAALHIASKYDQGDRLVEQRATSPGADGSVPRVLAERRWSYDRVGRVERIDDARWGSTTYAYDLVDQLLEAKRGTRREAFSYDGAGSIVAALQELEGVRQATDTELAPGNVLLRAGKTRYAYDKRGRRIAKVTAEEPGAAQTTEYAWDGRDLLRSATLADGTRAAITYDALGRRVRKETLPNGAGRPRVTDYVWDGNTLAMQMDSEEGLRAFVHTPGTFVPLLQQERGEVLAYVVDQVGTPKELLTRDGRVAWSVAHSAWGSVLDEHAERPRQAGAAGEIRSPFRLLGQIADDELDLHFTLYRIFDPAIGRWLSSDPIGIDGGLNLYAFDGAPSLVVDPWGLSSRGVVGKGHGKTFDQAREEAFRKAGMTDPSKIKDNKIRQGDRDCRRIQRAWRGEGRIRWPSYVARPVPRCPSHQLAVRREAREWRSAARKHSVRRPAKSFAAIAKGRRLMIDSELADAIRDALVDFPQVQLVPESDANVLIDRVAAKEVSDPDQTWWWSALRGAHATLPYGDQHGLEQVAHIAPVDASAYLAITDDEPRPWPLLSGTVADLLAVLNGLRFCEYFIFDRAITWIVFDTHHNSLVVTGILAQKTV